VEALIAHIQKAGRAAGTVAKITGLLSQVWNRAVARGVILGDCPTKRVKRPKQDNKRVRFLSEDEAKNLLAALALRSMDVHDEALLALFAGLWAGEIHKLTWGDVDFSAGTMFIRDAKNGTSRYAFLNAEIHFMLFRRYKEQAKADYVLAARMGVGYLCPDCYSYGNE
jgi:integrase